MDSVLMLRHKKWIFPFAITWMDLEGIMLSEVSYTEKDKYSYTESKKQNKQTKKKWKQIHRYREQMGGCWREGGLG